MYTRIVLVLITAAIGTALTGQAQSINEWKGDAIVTDWNDSSKWSLNHPPQETEPIHFRQNASVIQIDNTLELNNGMHLYGQELQLEGNGTINLRSPVIYQRSIMIPASGKGYANLTLAGNLSVNARITLAAKTFGSSACKGSLTLKNRSMLSGELAIGSDGQGTGHVFLQDESSYRITDLRLDTLAEKGGAAEIHILSGNLRIAAGDNPFAVFLEDSSRKIILGNNGTLHIESNLPPAEKKIFLDRMIEQRQLIKTDGSPVNSTPVIRDTMVLLKSGFISPNDISKAETPLETNKETENGSENDNVKPTAGLIVFLGALLLFLLKPSADSPSEPAEESATS